MGNPPIASCEICGDAIWHTGLHVCSLPVTRKEFDALQADVRTLARAIYDGLPLGDKIYRDGDELNSGQKKALALLRIAEGKP